MERIGTLTDFLFAPPNPRLLLVLWFAELSGFALWGYDGLPGLRFPLLLSVSSASGCVLAGPLSKAGGGGILFANALFLTLANTFSLGIFLEAGSPAGIALGFLFGLNVLVFATLAGLKTLKAGAPACVMPLTAHLVWTQIAPSSAPNIGASLAVMGLAWILCGTFFAIVGRPLGRLGLDFMDLFGRILGEYAGGGRPQTDPFAAFGSESEVACQTVVIERSGSRDAIVVPWIHPGPLGSLGGDLPARLRTALSGAFRRIVFLHTYVDHTRNPAGRDAAISGISAAVLRAAGREPRSGRATPFRSVRAGSATAGGLRIDGLHLIFTTFAPERTDDVSPELGTAFLSGFGGEAVLVDGHNALGPGGGRSRPIAPGDRRGGDLGEAIAALRRALDAEQALPLEIGISGRAVPASGVRHCSALVFRAGARPSAVVVLDANNLPTGLREEILRETAALGIEAGEVVTTDTHLADIPSATRAEWNGAGRALIVGSARAAVREAMADLRPARIRYGIERIPLRVWGPMFEKIVRAVPETARLGLIAGAGLILVFSLLAGLGAPLLR